MLVGTADLSLRDTHKFIRRSTLSGHGALVDNEFTASQADDNLFCR